MLQFPQGRPAGFRLRPAEGGNETAGQRTAARGRGLPRGGGRRAGCGPRGLCRRRDGACEGNPQYHAAHGRGAGRGRSRAGHAGADGHRAAHRGRAGAGHRPPDGAGRALVYDAAAPIVTADSIDRTGCSRRRATGEARRITSTARSTKRATRLSMPRWRGGTRAPARF